MEFHIARSLREKLDLKDVIFSYTGDVVFGSVAASRRVAAGLNELRGIGPADDAARAGKAVSGASLFAMGLIDELSHAMVARYRKEIDPQVNAEALRWFERKLGKPELDRLLLVFCERFPATTVYAGKMTAGEWLQGSEDGLTNREAALEELMMLWLANLNPAFKGFRELFADDDLQQQAAYTAVTKELPAYFDTRPPLSPEMGSLLAALQAPMKAAPGSLVEQLEFIRRSWTPVLGKEFGDELKRALLAIDVVREEDVAVWMRFHPPVPGVGHTEQGWESFGFRGDEYVGFEEEFVVGADGVRRPRLYASDHQAPLVEYEAFSPDQAWMPTVVMMAKNTYVWLEQLSKKYLRHIHRLDQIPEEELKTLADRGMTALWLIGLWERSVASRTIKRLRGQADAVASAYSLKDYNIAEDLGGNSAYEVLRDRAAAYGLRLASDMVPNHMGIDSPWVIEHPEWFVTRDESPFPSYRFDGPDLSPDSRAEIKIEDHYYDMTDAAVAFKLRNYESGRTHYMYHGNDGTTFAWNDTAQLDYSKAAVREHVMQVILHVARLFPIIRFDAAMVLAKRHVQRLWFPLPGVGGSIPSRAENAMSQEDFDALMPTEFWREVVDRVATEVPGTLLLAEAFWLLEGYFVRTLGMHRVYNSAFMNMLRDEENAKYRSYLKKTVEFDPDIMKRYVNFMSNPDERTAIDQFGDGDKYFGTCVLLATLPGLPMFAHGQIEGFGERYGMDFKEARVQEIPNQGLIDRYQREITPLLRTRWLFAESTHFVLYDFWTGGGTVDENVIAYSNREGNDRALILYNNVYGQTHGTIRISAASVDKGSGALVQRSLTEALALPWDNDAFVAYRDTVQGLEYLRRASDLRDNGLTVGLRGYQYLVLQQWRELRASADQPWDRLHDRLQGRGVGSVEDELTLLHLEPLHQAFRAVLACERAVPPSTEDPTAADTAVPPEEAAQSALKKQVPGIASTALDPLLNRYEAFYERLAEMSEDVHSNDIGIYKTNAHRLLKNASQTGANETPQVNDEQWRVALAWIAMSALPSPIDGSAIFDHLKLREALGHDLMATGRPQDASWRAAAIVRAGLTYEANAHTIASELFWKDGDVRWLAGVSEFEGTTYVSREDLSATLQWLSLFSSLQGRTSFDHKAVQQILQHVAAAEYRLDRFLADETVQPKTIVETGHASSSSQQTALPDAPDKTVAKSDLPQDRAAATATAKTLVVGELAGAKPEQRTAPKKT